MKPRFFGLDCWCLSHMDRAELGFGMVTTSTFVISMRMLSSKRVVWIRKKAL